MCGVCVCIHIEHVHVCSLCIYMCDVFVCTCSLLLIISEVVRPQCTFPKVTWPACSPQVCVCEASSSSAATAFLALSSSQSPGKALEISHVPFPFHQGLCEPERQLWGKMAASSRVGASGSKVAGGLFPARRQFWEPLCSWVWWGQKLSSCSSGASQPGFSAVAGMSWNLRYGFDVQVEYSHVFYRHSCVVSIAGPHH